MRLVEVCYVLDVWNTQILAKYAKATLSKAFVFDFPRKCSVCLSLVSGVNLFACPVAFWGIHSENVFIFCNSMWWW